MAYLPSSPSRENILMGAAILTQKKSSSLRWSLIHALKSHQIWPFENSQIAGAQKRFLSFYQISFLKTHSLLHIFQVRAHEHIAAEGLNFVHLA